MGKRLSPNNPQVEDLQNLGGLFEATPETPIFPQISKDSLDTVLEELNTEDPNYQFLEDILTELDYSASINFGDFTQKTDAILTALESSPLTTEQKEELHKTVQSIINRTELPKREMTINQENLFTKIHLSGLLALPPETQAKIKEAIGLEN